MLVLLGLAACGGTPPMTDVPDPATVRALHAEGVGDNVAVASIPLAMPPTAAAAHVVAIAAGLPRWTHHGSRERVIWLTRRTRLFRFTDDLLVLIEPTADGVTLLVRSASRLGKRDFGQNARNIAELRKALQEHP